MSPQTSAPWPGNQSWTAGNRRRFGHPNPDLRVSDAERADVADRLSRHYGDGRLDQAEFNERMERAMNAKTQGDFAGLFADLPDLAEPGATPPAPVSYQPPRSHSPMYRIAMLILLIVAAVVVSHLVFNSFFPWLLIALVAFLWLRHRDRSHRGA
jgi:hypothetical protein